MSISYDDAIGIKGKVTDLIAKAKTLEASAFGSVNWAHLNVVDIVEERSLLSPAKEIYVLVEEASPNSELAAWLTENLDVSGVTVRTEW